MFRITVDSLSQLHCKGYQSDVIASNHTHITQRHQASNQSTLQAFSLHSKLVERIISEVEKLDHKNSELD